MGNTYTIGQMVRVTATFNDSSGMETNPTSVVAKYRSPNGAVTSLVYGTDADVVRDSTGIYHIDLLLNAEGVWHYRVEGTGTVTAAAEGWLTAAESEFY